MNTMNPKAKVALMVSLLGATVASSASAADTKSLAAASKIAPVKAAPSSFTSSLFSQAQLLQKYLVNLTWN